MNPVLRWFHQLGSPPVFHAFAGRWLGWFYFVALPLLAYGLWAGLFQVPADYQQGDSYRILFVHVPSAWMSLFAYGAMAVNAFIALVWRIKLSETLAMCCAPIGAAFTAVTLATGSLWGKPMWGTWWTWDARLTSELVLLFLYLGYMGLRAGIEDPQKADKASAVLAIVGFVNVPIIRYSVNWWNSLHQPATTKLLGEADMDWSMVWPLLLMLSAFFLYFGWIMLIRLRAELLRRERNASWVREVLR
jgi:heme exporter protein C